MNNTLVIYHGGCRDGFCAAWVVWKYLHKITDVADSLKWPPVIFHPGFYGQEPPDCRGKNVIIVDFSYDRDRMWGIAKTAESLTWLDHHKTALPINELFESNGLAIRNLKYDFDLNRSGAGIAWDFFFQDEPRPWLVDYVEDRDLWLHKLHESHSINAYIACLEFEFDLWEKASIVDIELAVENGNIALLKTEQYIREVCKNVYFADVGYNKHLENDDWVYEQVWRDIPTVNIPQVDCSEVMDALLKLYPDSPFSLYWFRRPDGMYQYGMRSLKETHDFDVSSVAKLFGGGGHKNAAGFQLNYLLEELK